MMRTCRDSTIPWLTRRTEKNHKTSTTMFGHRPRFLSNLVRMQVWSLTTTPTYTVINAVHPKKRSISVTNHSPSLCPAKSRTHLTYLKFGI
jgi:hypothetical protein